MLTRPARAPALVSFRNVLIGVLATITLALLGERSWRLRRSVDTIERRTMRIQTALIDQGLHLDATGEIPRLSSVPGDLADRLDLTAVSPATAAAIRRLSRRAGR